MSIGDLKELYRDVVILHCLGCSNKEIGKGLDRAPGTVASQLTRARRFLDSWHHDGDDWEIMLMERGELAYEGGGTAIVEELRDRPNARLRNRVHRLLRGRNTFQVRFADPNVQARARELVGLIDSEPARNALAISPSIASSVPK